MKTRPTALVTGATSGIGESAALALARAGHRVFIVGRQPRKLAQVAKKIGARRIGGTLRADLSSPVEIRALAREVATQMRGLDLLLHCAGEYEWTRPGDTDAASFARLFDINVRAPFLLTQALLPHLARARGQVVFLNSSITRNPGAGVALYKATQHAVQGLTDSLRQDLNTEGVRVSSLFLGRTATPRMRRIYAHEGKPYRPGPLLQADAVGELVLAITRLPRGMEVTDVHVRSAVPY
ncbi:MAG: SDR family NAD(P)-dependent oxidoreductase [Proteobacteria bacterium]|nr:SDR family NAD(P)-dependent oxidoreductase [Pseudomonadota bacterium]